MLTPQPTKLFSKFKKKNKKLRGIFFPWYSYKLPTPNEIRDQVEKMTSCPKCQFLIFENYWTDEIENRSNKLCPTCGYKL